MRRPLLSLSMLLASCAGAGAAPEVGRARANATPAAASTAPPAAPPPAGARYLLVFDELVRRIERDHVFPPAYPRDVGHPFRDELPRLREEWLHARTRDEVLVALRHLQNSLRELHCYLDPPADAPRRHLVLPVGLWAGGTVSSPEVRIDEVHDRSLSSELTSGDLVESVDGVSTARWLAEHRWEASQLPPAQYLPSTVERIRLAELPWSTVRAGDARVLGILHGGARREVTLRFRTPAEMAEEPDLDNPPPTAKIECDASRKTDYGDYAVSAIGVNVCVYTPTKPGRPRVPVVRWPSFDYGANDSARSLRMVRADHDLLTRALKDADGVVVDVRDNHGGSNPFLFLRWLTRGPWDHERVVTRIVPGIDDTTLTRVLFGDEHLAGWREAEKAGRPTIETRFLCLGGRCDDVRTGLDELVTRAPVALLVGAGCVSSCDTLALTWSAFGLGPMVGRQPAHSYTVHRLPIHVAGPEGEDLGTFRLAISHSELRGTNIEGEPLRLDWEAPRTFEGRDTWGRDAVAEARRRLTPRP